MIISVEFERIVNDKGNFHKLLMGENDGLFYGLKGDIGSMEHHNNISIITIVGGYG
jgi:hypothetical protein